VLLDFLAGVDLDFTAERKGEYEVGRDMMEGEPGEGSV